MLDICKKLSLDYQFLNFEAPKDRVEEVINNSIFLNSDYAKNMIKNFSASSLLFLVKRCDSLRNYVKVETFMYRSNLSSRLLDELPFKDTLTHSFGMINYEDEVISRNFYIKEEYLKKLSMLFGNFILESLRIIPISDKEASIDGKIKIYTIEKFWDNEISIKILSFMQNMRSRDKEKSEIISKLTEFSGFLNSRDEKNATLGRGLLCMNNLQRIISLI